MRDQFSSVQSLSRVRLFVTPWIAARQASLSITNSQSSLRLTSIESVMPSNHLILCRPLLLLPPIFPSIRVFSNESTLHMRWPKYWSFSFSIILSKEIPGLISFRMDWEILFNISLELWSNNSIDYFSIQGQSTNVGQQINKKALESGWLWHELFLCHLLLVNLGQVSHSVSSILILEKCLPHWLLWEENKMMYPSAQCSAQSLVSQYLII